MNRKRKARLLTIVFALWFIGGVLMLIDASISGEVFALDESFFKTKFSERPYRFLFAMFFHTAATLFALFGVFVFAQQWKLERMREHAANRKS
jgi:hypothetical protein